MEVISGSAAEKAGLKQGDHIISFAGVPIASRDQLIDLIRKRGEQLTELRVDRGAQKWRLTSRRRLIQRPKAGESGVALV